MKTSEFFRSANYPYPSNKKAVRRIKSGKRPFQYALVPGGRPDYPHARRLLLAADCGGSNGYNRRMFKKYPADFAMEAGLEIHVCHYPPGCSKYNKIERRLFSQISISMQGRPPASVPVFQKLIEHTPTSAGLTVQCVPDENVCLKGRKISDKRFAALPVIHDIRLGDWNYVISSLRR